MLNRGRQQLLGALGAGMAADALLDRLRERGTLEGGRSWPQEGCWINYNRKAVWLEDHSEFYAALRAAGDAGATDGGQAWRRIRPRVVLKATWSEAAAYGASLPQALRNELDTLRRTERAEKRRWSESSDQCGGWPHRRRFDSDEEHQVVQAAWDSAYGKDLLALRDVWDHQESAIARALPLTVDDEPVDLLELLDQQPAAPISPALTPIAVLQAGALRAAATNASTTSATPDEGHFTLPNSDPSIGR